MEKIVDLACKQVDIFKRERCFEIFNQHYLQIVKKGKKRQQDYRVDLISLSPESERVLNIALHWAGLALFFLLSDIGLIFYMLDHQDSNNLVMMVVAVLVLTLMTAGSIYLLLYNSDRSEVFSTRFAGIPLVEIWVANPDKDVFNYLVEEIKNGILKVSAKHDLPVDKLQAGEMKMLRRLSEQGVLTRNDYEKAKATLFNVSDSG